MRDSKYKRFKRIYPWFSAFATDLLFYVAIGELFLSVEKGFSASQIVSLTSISLLVSLALDYPLYLIIKKIGNTASIRAGSILLFASSILLTFGGYFVALAGKIIYEISLSLLTMANVILKNNVNFAGTSEEYVELNSKSNSMYSLLTLLVALCASFIFNVNHYLAMLCSSLCAVVTIVMSFMIKDITPKRQPSVDKRPYHRKFKFNELLTLTIITFMLFFPIITISQLDSKLLIQYELLDNFSVEKTAIIFGVVVFLSIVVRLLSNVIFTKVYQKIKEKVSVIFAVQLVLALALIVVGAVISAPIYVKIIFMAVGFFQFLFIRDPAKVFLWNFAMDNSGLNNKQTVITLLNIGNKLFRAIFSMISTIILLFHEMLSVIYVLFGLSIIPLVLNIVLFVKIKKDKEQKFQADQQELQTIQEKVD